MGYNYGAGHIDRVRQILKTMMAAEIAVGLVSLLCFQMFPRQITALFGSGDALYEEFAVMAFRTFLCTIPLCCVQKAGSIFLQSLGRPLEAMSLSLAARDRAQYSLGNPSAHVLSVSRVHCTPPLWRMLYPAPLPWSF